MVMVKVCILGYGGIARAHEGGYKSELSDKGIGKLTAVCDINPDKFSEKVEINISADASGETPEKVNTYTNLDEMLECEQPDIVSITLPTYLHKEKTIYVLKKGYNVFCEKPMALSYADCLEMLAAAEESGKKLMIGQVLHFFPEYEYLKEAVADGRFGAVHSAFFHRLSTPPVWGFENWFMDAEKSGGCIQDLHIHDIDLARYLFGEPERLSCTSHKGYSDYESAFSTLWYKDFAVSAIGDWSLSKFPFEMYYRVAFDKAVVEMRGGKVTVVTAEGEKIEPELKRQNGYGAEVAYFAKAITDGGDMSKNDPESAALSIKLVEALKKSADNGGAVIEYKNI